MDPRIGSGSSAGLGFGGHRLPEGCRALERLAERSGSPFPLLAESAKINREVIEAVVKLARIRPRPD